MRVQEGDIIEPEELEAAAYEYVRLYGDGGEMHGGAALPYSLKVLFLRKRKCRLVDRV